MNWKILLGLGAIIFVSAAPQARRTPEQIERREQRRRRGARVAHGVTIVDGKLKLVDWAAWMDWAPPAIQRVRGYGAETGEQIAIYMFHQLFPQRQWPPAPYDPLTPTWDLIVADIVALMPLLVAEERKALQTEGNVIPIRSS